MSDDDMLAHYSAALDEIFRLRQAAAWEAHMLGWALMYATLPKRVRAQLETAREALAATARGVDRYSELPAESRALAMAAAKAPPTLTRHQWEHRNDKADS